VIAAFVIWNGFNVWVEHGNGGGNSGLSLSLFFSFRFTRAYLVTNHCYHYQLHCTALLLFPPRAFLFFCLFIRSVSIHLPVFNPASLILVNTAITNFLFFFFLLALAVGVCFFFLTIMLCLGGAPAISRCTGSEVFYG